MSGSNSPFRGSTPYNLSYSPETMSIIERSWRMIGVMATMVLIHCGMMTNASIDNLVLPVKADRKGLRQSPFEKLNGVIPSLDELPPFDCRGYTIIMVNRKTHNTLSEQDMHMSKEFVKIWYKWTC